MVVKKLAQVPASNGQLMSMAVFSLYSVEWKHVNMFKSNKVM